MAVDLEVEKVKIITELDLREMFKARPFEIYQIELNSKMTPAATEFLNERKIRVIDQTGKPIIGSQHRRMMGDTYKSSNNLCSVKPEECTHLQGNKIVLKTHERIKFRGKLDSLEAYLISIIIEFKKEGQLELSEELFQLLKYFEKMMRSEVLDIPLEFIEFNGWSENEIKNRSHHPEKFYGIKHFTPDPSQGAILAGLNQLRTKVRELEISAVSTFLNCDTDNAPRRDIILSLNRLSSLVYVLMCQYLGGVYEQNTRK